MADVATERAPFRGIQTVSYLQEAGTCEIALNVDFSDGTIRGRPGYTVLAHAAGTVTGMFAHVHKSGRKYLLVVRASPVTHNSAGYIGFYVYDENGTWLDSQDLTLSSYWPSLDRFTFAEVGDRVFFCNGQGPVMIFDGDTGYDAVPMVLSEGKYKAALHYLSRTPIASIVENHQGILLYAKLLTTMNASIFGVLPPRQDAVGEEIISDELRSILSYGDRHFLWSDLLKPENICASSYTAVVDGEPVTALAVQGGNIYPFARCSTHRVVGIHVGGDDAYETQEISRTVGCVAHRTIRYVDGRFFFLAENGVYSMSEEEGLQRVSEPLSRLFGNRWDPVVPNQVWSTLGSAGWPWRLSGEMLHLAAAEVIPSAGLYLVTLTPTSQSDLPNSLTLAYHWPSGAWSIWHPTRVSHFRPQCWTRFKTDGNTVFFGNSNGDVCRLDPLGRATTDKTDAGAATTIPLLYVSRRYHEGDEDRKELGQLLFRVRGSGVSRASRPAVYVGGEENQHDKMYATTTMLQGQKQESLDMHPGLAKGAKYYYGYGKYGTVAAGGDGMCWVPEGYQTIARSFNIVSRWFQWAWLEDTTTGNLVEIYGIRNRFERLGEEF